VLIGGRARRSTSENSAGPSWFYTLAVASGKASLRTPSRASRNTESFSPPQPRPNAKRAPQRACQTDGTGEAPNLRGTAVKRSNLLTNPLCAPR
jgi:hypothetical protein